mgnify:CR=1 FL=1
MDNLAIARVLAEIGDLLEIKNENPFKIRAYRNAADTIAHFNRLLITLGQNYVVVFEDFGHGNHGLPGSLQYIPKAAVTAFFAFVHYRHGLCRFFIPKPNILQ